MNFTNTINRILPSSVWLVTGLFLLATGARAQASATNFGSVNLCASGQTAAACSNIAVYSIDNVPGLKVSVLTEGEPGLDFQTVLNVCTGPRCRIQVAFRPLHPGLRRGVLLATNSAGQVTESVPLYGVGVGAQLGFGFSAQTSLISGVKVDALTVDGTGTIYFADTKAQTVSKLPSGGAPEVLTSGFSPSALVLDGGGNLYIGDQTNERLLKLSPSLTISVLMRNVAVTGLATDGAGNVIVADSASNSIKMLALNGTNTTLATGSAYTGVAVDGAGDLFAETAEGRVIEISPDKGKKVVANQIDPTIASLGLDAAGSIYVRNHFTLLNIPQSQVAQPTTGSQPDAAALDASANIYYADNVLGRILRVNRAATTIQLPRPIPGELVSTLGAFPIENTGNAPMIGVAAALAGDPTQAQSTCETIQPGQTCYVELNVPPFLAQEGTQAVMLGYTSNNQFFTATIPVSFTQVSASTLQLTGTMLAGVSTYTVTVEPNTSTGTITLQYGNSSCSLPLSAGAVSCSFPSSLIQQDINTTYSGDPVTSGQTAIFAPVTTSSGGPVGWNRVSSNPTNTDPGTNPPPPSPGCSSASSYDLCGGQNQ